MRVSCVHLNNDFSGAPLVLREIQSALEAAGAEVRCFTSAGPGFLVPSDGERCRLPRPYTRRGKLRAMALWAWAQVAVFRAIFADTRRGDVVLVNTIQPVGAALAARLRGARVVYWVHETVFRPAALKGLLFGAMRRLAHRTVYVSRFVQEREASPREESCVVHNTLPEDFWKRAEERAYRHTHDGIFRVVQLSSLRDYKGVREFAELARSMVQHAGIHFVLKVSADERELARFAREIGRPGNLTLLGNGTGVLNVYERASLVVNLSRPDEWIETFGLTLLEAFAYGIPVIAPPVGGPLEIVQAGENGFTCDPYDTEELRQLVLRLYSDEALCQRMSASARERSREFSRERFERRVRDLLGEMRK